MVSLQNFSIKGKLVLIIISVSLVAIIVGFSIITYFNIRNLKRDLINQSTLIAKLMVEYSEFALVFGDTRVAKENLSKLKAIPTILSAEIYDSNGKFFTSYQDKKAHFSELIIIKSKFEFQNNMLYIFEPVYSSDNEIVGSLFIKVSQENLTKDRNNYIFWLFSIILFVFILIIILAGNFQKIISKPILKLADLTQKISKTHDYTIRIENKLNDEIGILYDGFNNMLEEIVKNEKEIINTQNELRDSKELFSKFMEMLPAAAYIKNSDSTFSYINKFLADEFNAELWIGKSEIVNLPSDKKIISSSFDQEALSSIQHFEDYMYDLKNELRYFETWKFPIYRNNKPAMIGGIAIDTTMRKVAEKQLNFYIKELERNNKELEEFNYVASHDLREPLRTITSYCELLSEDIGHTLNDTVKEDIKFITDATSRMNVLIQDLLQLSRAGRVEYELGNVDLNKVIKLVLQDLELKIKETNTTINLKQMPIVVGDSVQLGRVFQNLITNAIKFKSEKEPIIDIEAVQKNNFIEIIVADNGIGIEKQYHQQIFSAFKRLHARGKYEGTGIGLAICKKIVERHNGNIILESETGLGSKFKVQLKKALI